MNLKENVFKIEEILEEIFFQATVLKFGDLVGAG